MKIRQAALLPLLALLSHGSSGAEPIPVQSTIESVSLFRDGARVTRQAEVPVPAGKSILAFPNLPSHVDQSALQAELQDAAGIIRNAKIYRPADQDDNAEVEALKQKLEEHLKEKRAVQEDIKIAETRIEFAKELSESFANGYGDIADDGSSLTLEQGMKTLDLAVETRRAERLAIESANDTLRTLEKTEEKLRRQLREAQESQNLTRSVAEVEIDMDRAQTIGIALHYQALAARWQPQYELRAKPAESQLEFGYIASVWQKTGEDWSDIELALHTNQAARSGNVPELDPMRLQQMERPVPLQSPARAPEAYELSPFMIDGAVDNRGYSKAEAAPPPSQQRIAVTSSAVSFQATLPSLVSVPSADDPSLLPIATADFESDYWSETVPKQQLSAYLRAEATNGLDLPILPGSALAFVDGALSSRVQLEKTLPGESITLSLGIDPNIVVERIEGSQKDKNTGFIDKTVTLKRSFTNTVTNHHAKPHRIVVVDQFPIATNAKIEITRLAPETSEVTVKPENENTGIFQWESEAKPQETLSFRTEYEVQHPRDWNIVPQP